MTHVPTLARTGRALFSHRPECSCGWVGMDAAKGAAQREALYHTRAENAKENAVVAGCLPASAGFRPTGQV